MSIPNFYNMLQSITYDGSLHFKLKSPFPLVFTCKNVKVKSAENEWVGKISIDSVSAKSAFIISVDTHYEKETFEGQIWFGDAALDVKGDVEYA